MRHVDSEALETSDWCEAAQFRSDWRNSYRNVKFVNRGRKAIVLVLWEIGPQCLTMQTLIYEIVSTLLKE